MMSNLDQFRQYAKEAMLAAGDAKSREDKQELFALARTWIVAALLEQQSSKRVRHRRQDHWER